jgi:hypothetical protein
MEDEEVTMIVQISVDTTTSILTREMTFFKKEGNHFLKHKEKHRQQLFDRFTIKDTLNLIGFEVSIIDHYINNTFRKGHFAFICKK